MTVLMKDEFTMMLKERGRTAIAAWLYFGGRTPDVPGPWGIEATYAITAAVSAYRCTGVLARIASDRTAERAGTVCSGAAIKDDD
jgi:hypothetical protein